MVIFGTPDFGASGVPVLFLLIVWAIVLTLVSIGIVRGIRLLKSDSSKARKYGVLLLVVSGLVPFSCCLGPSQVVRLVYGNYPIGERPNNKIQEGMSFDEVTAILGTPHERFKKDDQESWYYWIDSFGIGWFAVDFGPDGNVERTYGN